MRLRRQPQKWYVPAYSNLDLSLTLVQSEVAEKKRTAHLAISDPLPAHPEVPGTPTVYPLPNPRTQTEVSLDETSAQRSKICAADGLRHPAFLKLPYWDPSRMVTSDPMHCFCEGLPHDQVLRDTT